MLHIVNIAYIQYEFMMNIKIIVYKIVGISVFIKICSIMWKLKKYAVHKNAVKSFLHVLDTSASESGKYVSIYVI